MKQTVAGLTIVAALAAAPVVAQERPLGQRADSTAHPGMMQPGMMQGMHGQAGMMGSMGMMGDGMMGMVGGPAMILRLEKSLDLTEAQVERLKALQESAQSGMRQHMMQGMQGMHAAQELLKGESPDVAAYEERLREAANHMVLAHSAMARATVEARGLLTPQQKERLALARTMMQEMRGGMMDGMMPGMMQGHDPVDGAGHGH